VRESRRGASRAAESPTTLGSEPAPVPPPQSASLHRGEAGSLTAAERVREKPGPAFRTNSSLALLFRSWIAVGWGREFSGTSAGFFTC